MEELISLRKLVKKLVSWYKINKRDLPWRKTKDPYSIWLSEVMLQQTTSKAVIPFYFAFLDKFPTVYALAAASEPEVLSAWAGLGYYSRARNLHKAAKILSIDFPKTAEQLLQLPGFGPYTSRSVASLAFEEKVGVLDGNVIRVISRLKNDDSTWWTPPVRKMLQDFVDQAVLNSPYLPSEINQALMELGATVCIPSQPACPLCPLFSDCEARKCQTQDKLPLPKPRKKIQRFLWTVQLYQRGDQIAIARKHNLPILKNQSLPPGDFKPLPSAPKNFTFTHTITHHLIHVEIQKVKTPSTIKTDFDLINLTNYLQHNPSSIIRKILRYPVPFGSSPHQS